MQVSASGSADSQRAEFETVLAALERTPRPAKLLGCLAEKYLAGDTDEIVEYNIATDVFGRSRTTFDASRDSIAWVEAHRLRKKLKEYYETEGNDHLIQISLPTGSYVPAFIHRSPAPNIDSKSEMRGIAAAEDSPPPALVKEAFYITEDSTEAKDATASAPTETANPPLPPSRRLTLLLAGFAGLAFLLMGFGLSRLLLWYHSVQQRPATSSAKSVPSQSAAPSDAAKVPLRILAG